VRKRAATGRLRKPLILGSKTGSKNKGFINTKKHCKVFAAWKLMRLGMNLIAAGEMRSKDLQRQLSAEISVAA
jgi:hypothetical protein